MDLLDGVDAVVGAADGPVDVDAVRRAATATTEPGDVGPSTDRERYRRAFEAAAGRAREATTLSASPPAELELLDRHQWLEVALADEQWLRERSTAVERGPLREGVDRLVALATTAPQSVVWSTLAGHALGRYDPLNWVSVAVGPGRCPSVVVPNVERVAGRLDADRRDVARWVVAYQVAVATTHDGVDWLGPQLREAVASHLWGGVDETDSPRLHATAVLTDAYASRLAARLLDGGPDLRAAVARHRWNRDPVTRVARRLSLLPEGGAAVGAARSFLDAVADARGPGAVDAVWTAPETLPTLAELGLFGDDGGREATPAAGAARWLARVDP